VHQPGTSGGFVNPQLGEAGSRKPAIDTRMEIRRLPMIDESFGSLADRPNSRRPLLTVSQVVRTNDNIWLHLARAISREIRKRAKNVTRQYLLQKHVDKVKLKVRFCSLLDVVLETNDQQKECGGF
jgi:hypothetical protein